MSRKGWLRAIASVAVAIGLSPVLNAGAAVFVRIAPPRPVVERAIRAPGPRYVWTGGYYRWSGRAYVWAPGRWVYPPRPAAVWVAPHWRYVPARRGYVFVAGFWR